MSDTLKYIILILFTIFMAAGVYIFQPISAGVEAFKKTAPCSQPFHYSIGSIDPRFSISEAELEDAVEAAVTVWNSDSDIQLFTKQDDVSHSENIVIRLLYDGRQERTDREIRFRERIRSEQIRLDRQQTRHDEKRAEFEKRSSSYKKTAERTTEQLNELNNWVKERNENGGFTESDLEQFERRKRDVEQAQDQVRDEQQALAKIALEINREMDELNETFDEHNQLIEKYNDEFAGDLRFAKATFQKTTNGGIVTVNQFLNDKELTLIIAHELGHALGITHLQQPESIMYSVMGAQQINPSIRLTSADLQAVQQLCN